MFILDHLVRKNISSLAPYSSAREEFTGSDGIFLDANENPYGSLNRYPDPQQSTLKAQLSVIKNVPVENIFIGNGSDEAIDVLIRIFCTPSTDKILVCPPTYGMYEVAANIQDVAILKAPLTNDFQLDIYSITNIIQQEEHLKLIFLCSPNNPTGNSLKGISSILNTFKGIVVVDEAYIDFSSETSYAAHLAKYPNLVVLQTFSKAWGLAAARTGMAYACTEIIKLMNKVKPPYNVSLLNQQAALAACEQQQTTIEYIQTIIAQRLWLEQALHNLACVVQVYPSDANFLLVAVKDANTLYEALVAKKIIIRNRHSIVANCLRITVGTAQENKELIDALQLVASDN